MVLHQLQLVSRATIGMVRLASTADRPIITAYLAPTGMASSVVQRSLPHLVSQVTLGTVKPASILVPHHRIANKDTLGMVIVVFTMEDRALASQVMCGTE
jgi:hypothetical protein